MHPFSGSATKEMPTREPSSQPAGLAPEAWRRLVADGCSIMLLVLQPILFFWRVLINPRTHIPFDLEGFHLPQISYVAQCLRQGVAPLWDPYPYCGVPIHADLQAQVFYPFTWLAILAGNRTQGHNLFYWVQCLVPLHMILAGLFVFMLLRQMGIRPPAALLGASVFQLGGYFASQAQHLGAICTGPWLPLAILAVFELKVRVTLRWIGVLGIAVAMSILAGFAATALIVAGAVLLVVAALLAVRDASWRLVPAVAAGFLVGSAIAAVEIIPLWQLSQFSIASMRAAWSGTGGLTPQVLVSLVSPNYYHLFDAGPLLPKNFTFLYAYCGIATIVLLALAPFVRTWRPRIFLLVTILSAFWMLGGHTPVYRSVYVHLPGLLRGALYAEYALIAFCFFAGITAALVLDRIGNRAPQVVLWALALFTSYDLIHTGSNRPMNSASGGYKSADSEYGPAGSPELLMELRALVNRTSPPSRIDYTDGIFSQGFRGSDMLDLPTANGDNPFMFRRMWRLRRLFATGRPWDRQLSVNRIDSPLLSMMNVGWLIGGSPLPPDDVRRAGLEPAGELRGLWMYRNPRALPRFFLAAGVRRSSGEEETFRMLAEPGFDPARQAIVEGLPENLDRVAAGDVRVKLYSANRIRLSATTAGPAFLGTSEPMYAGWEARVNGKPQAFRITNGAFRGLALPAGTSEIVMEYHPPYLALSLILSLISFIGASGAVLSVQRLWQTTAAPKTVSRRAELVEWLQFAFGRLYERWTARIVARRSTLRWLSLLLLATVLFYWRILLTRQFSLLTDWEGVTQAYSWLQFWTAGIRHGILPLWDPYTLAGHSFIGEMQTAAFYPLHLLLALFPPNQNGVLSPNLYHLWFVFTHFLGACFMFALARELKLSRFAAFLAGICFSLGGFVARMPWPHMLESSIWLPLLFLFFLRAIRVYSVRRAIFNSALAGLALGLSILAGGMHLVILQALVIVSAGVYHAFICHSAEPLSSSRRQSWRSRQSWMRAAIVVAVIAAVGFAAGAVQLLPSIEYSGQALRFLGKAGALPGNEKIPYTDLSEGLWPNSFVAMLIPQAFNGNIGAGEVISPYMGVLPLLLVILGIWRAWPHPWVRYLTGLALAAFLYSLGSLSPLHGILYAIVPRLWMAREAGRVVYLADFSFAILAAYGVESLLSHGFRSAISTTFDRILAGTVIACAAGLFVPALYGRPELSPWVALSILLIILSYALFRYISRGNTGSTARALIAMLILFDLSAFDWMARNTVTLSRTGTNHLDRLMSARGAAQFLKSQRSPYRVEVPTDQRPNIGDAFGIPTTSSAGVTIPIDFIKFGKHADLLNVRYRLMPASTPDPGAVYQDLLWKVYENPNAYPRAWVVHAAIVEPSVDLALTQLEAPEFDARRTAVVDRPVVLEPPADGAAESATFSTLEPNRLELNVHMQSRGLLVLSEMFYPGWRATVNGRAVRVYRADGALRGIEAPPGDSRIILEYRPWSVYLGGLLTLAAFLGTLAGPRFLPRLRSLWVSSRSLRL